MEVKTATTEVTSAAESVSKSAAAVNESVAKELPFNLDARYDVKEVIGEGGYAVVKKAYRRSDRKIFAVKIVKRANLPADDELSLRQEVKILQSLSKSSFCILLASLVELMFNVF